MENGICISKLQQLAQEFGIRIWTCKKTGKRWAFINGAGEPKVLESELIYESGEIGVFVQGENFDRPKLIQIIKEELMNL